MSSWVQWLCHIQKRIALRIPSHPLALTFFLPFLQQFNLWFLLPNHHTTIHYLHFSSLKLLYLFTDLCVYPCMCACYGKCVEVRAQLTEVGSHFLPCGFWWSNLLSHLPAPSNLKILICFCVCLYVSVCKCMCVWSGIHACGLPQRTGKYFRCLQLLPAFLILHGRVPSWTWGSWFLGITILLPSPFRMRTIGVCKAPGFYVGAEIWNLVFMTT